MPPTSDSQTSAARAEYKASRKRARAIPIPARASSSSVGPSPSAALPPHLAREDKAKMKKRKRSSIQGGTDEMVDLDEGSGEEAQEEKRIKLEDDGRLQAAGFATASSQGRGPSVASQTHSTRPQALASGSENIPSSNSHPQASSSKYFGSEPHDAASEPSSVRTHKDKSHKKDKRERKKEKGKSFDHNHPAHPSSPRNSGVSPLPANPAAPPLAEGQLLPVANAAGALERGSHSSSAMEDLKAYRAQQKAKEASILAEKERARELQESKEEAAKLRGQVEFKDQTILAQTAIIEHVTQAVTCNVCLEIFRNPFILSPCGHTACASCLVAWFRSEASLVRPLAAGQFNPLDNHAHRTKCCFTCRSPIQGRPVSNFVIKDLLDSIRAQLEISAGEAQAPAVEEPARGVDMWEGLFRPVGDRPGMRWYLDEEDAVRRCTGCGHEIEGRECGNCGEVFSDLSSEMDESDDGFLVGSEDEDLSDLHSGSEDGIIWRHRGGWDEEDGNGFDDEENVLERLQYVQYVDGNRHIDPDFGDVPPPWILDGVARRNQRRRDEAQIVPGGYPGGEHVVPFDEDDEYGYDEEEDEDFAYDEDEDDDSLSGFLVDDDDEDAVRAFEEREGSAETYESSSSVQEVPRPEWIRRRNRRLGVGSPSVEGEEEESEISDADDDSLEENRVGRRANANNDE